MAGSAGCGRGLFHRQLLQGRASDQGRGPDVPTRPNQPARPRPLLGLRAPVTISKETRALVRILEHHGITVVLDVGANVGQYATRLRQGGWAGRIVSFEPLPTARIALEQAAATDPLWEVAPPMALGASAGTVTLNVSAESDMSSTLP